jgi:hypothetical protein
MPRFGRRVTEKLSSFLIIEGRGGSSACSEVDAAAVTAADSPRADPSEIQLARSPGEAGGVHDHAGSPRRVLMAWLAVGGAVFFLQTAVLYIDNPLLVSMRKSSL